MADVYEQKKLADQAQVQAECEELEGEIAALRAAYEQYFLGLEKKPPNDQHNALKKRLGKLKGLYVRQTAMKFRMQSVQSKFVTYERLWARTLQEIENGTYRRDLAKARRKHQNDNKPKQATKKAERDDFSIDEVSPEEADALLSGAFDESPAPAPAVAPIAPVIAPVAPVTPPAARAAAPSSAPGVPRITPAVAAAPTQRPASAPPSRGVTVPPPSATRPPPSSPASAAPGLGDDKLRAVYDAYVKAKKRCNEDVSNMSYDQVASSLRKQVPELMKKTNARAVEFKVVIKDGKAVLRAVPKDG